LADAARSAILPWRAVSSSSSVERLVDSLERHSNSFADDQCEQVGDHVVAAHLLVRDAELFGDGLQLGELKTH
jgi:hypothetical protein